MEFTRRAFLSILSLAAGALVTLPSLVARAKKLALPLTKVPALEKVDGAVTLNIKGRTVLFVRDGETSVRAIDPTCTHKQCTVVYQPAQKGFECPCHQSRFSADGKVLSGPAPAPLETFPAELDGDRILLTLPDEG
jgi:cytochrome b6-f complex iron-sulfur subunit